MIDDDPFDVGLTHEQAVSISEAIAKDAAAWRKLFAGQPVPIELEPEDDQE
jgi:hypothetical protein